MKSVTTNQASVVDSESFTVRRTIYITAPIDKVWRAVSEPSSISKWFGQATFTGTGVGATGTLSWPGHVSPVRVEAIDAPRMASYRWGSDNASGQADPQVDEANSTVFTFTLETVSGGTQLTLVESGFEVMAAPEATMEDHRGGWDSELDELVALFGITS